MKFGTTFAALAALSASAFAKTTSTSTSSAAAETDSTSLKASLTSTTSIAVASGCSFSSTFTATAQSDLDELNKCDAVSGDILIEGDLGSAAIANVKVIYGDLTVNNATSLELFTADSITTITGALSLQGLTVLSTLSFGSLESVGALEWMTLPNLIETGLSKVTECNSILISDTNLDNLDGLNPTDVEIFNINNNFNLASISSNIETVSNALTVAFNGDNTVVEFNDLQWANNLTFYSVASIAMESISYVNKSAGFFKLSAEELEFPLITGIGGDLTIENNEELNYIDFGNVTSIGGGLVIVNNTDLVSIDNLDAITTVQGAVILKGDFDNCTMNDLTTVRGSFDLDTTGYADCAPFKKLSKKGGIQGDYSCKAKTRASSSASSSTKSDSSTTATKGSDSSSTSGAVSSISSASSKGDAQNLKASSLFATIGALFLALL